MSSPTCDHVFAIEILSSACFGALEGDTREARRWCPMCGALQVTDALDRSFRAWLAPVQKGEVS